jgi:flagellar basal body-associated protein FliL
MSNQDPGDGPAKGGRRRRIALLALPVVLLAAGLVVYIQYGASFFGSPEGAEQASGVVEGDPEAQEMAAVDVMSDELTLMPLREIIVNISALNAARRADDAVSKAQPRHRL